MRRGRPLKVEWRHSAEELYERYQQEKDVERRKRLQAMWNLREGKTITETHRQVGVSYRTVQRWVKWYQEDGLERMLSRTPGHGAQGGQAWLNPIQQKALVAKVNTGAFRTVWEALEWVEARWGVRYGYKGMYTLMQRLRLKPKVPRRQAEKADKAAQEAWKKGG
jgi:transposase